MTDYTFVGDPTTESSVSINGVRLADFGVHLLADSEEPALPQTRDRTLVIPDRHGEYNFGSYFGARLLNLSCGFNNQATLADAQRLIRELNTLLLDEYGRPKEVELVYDYEPDKFYKATLSGAVPVNRISRAGTFVLPMKASDPFAYSSSKSYDEKPKIYDTGFLYDTGLMYENYSVFNWKYNRYYFGNFNYSQYNTKPKVTIKGNVINPRIKNLISGREIKLPSLMSDDILIVDFNTATIVKNNKNVFMEYRGDFFELGSGDIHLMLEGGKPSATVSIEWLHKFM